MRKPTPAHRLSLRAFARARSVKLSAVQRAITDGRLTKHSVGRTTTGRPFIKDPKRAGREWDEHTRPRVAAEKPEAAAGAGSNGAIAPPSALSRATQRERDARAALAELEYQRKLGKYVLLEDYERGEAARIVRARTVLGGLPTRAKQRLPHLASSDLVVLEQLVREALEELASSEQMAAKGASA